MEPLQGTMDDITGRPNDALYSNEFFNGDGDFTL